MAIVLPVGAQAPAPVAVPEKPEIKSKVEALKSAARARKFDRDIEVVRLIAELVHEKKRGLHKNDSKRAFRALATILNKGRVRKPSQREVYTLTVRALVHFGTDAAQVIQKAYSGKRFPDRDGDWLELRTLMLESIGKTKDEDSVDFLIDVARRAKDSLERAASGQALYHFKEFGGDVRKRIVKALVNELAGLDAESRRTVQTGGVLPEGGARDVFGPHNARERLEKIKAPWIFTLKHLTGESFDKPREWQSWFNTARKQSWGK